MRSSHSQTSLRGSVIPGTTRAASDAAVSRCPLTPFHVNQASKLRGGINARSSDSARGVPSGRVVGFGQGSDKGLFSDVGCVLEMLRRRDQLVRSLAKEPQNSLALERKRMWEDVSASAEYRLAK